MVPRSCSFCSVRRTVQRGCVRSVGHSDGELFALRGRSYVLPCRCVQAMLLTAACRMPLTSSLARRCSGHRYQRWRDYHATPVRREALSNADVVAWHDGASVIESVAPNGLIAVNGVTIQGSVMVFPRLCLLWHVRGLEVRLGREDKARVSAASLKSLCNCAAVLPHLAAREQAQPLTAVNLPPTPWCDPQLCFLPPQTSSAAPSSAQHEIQWTWCTQSISSSAWARPLLRSHPK